MNKTNSLFLLSVLFFCVLSRASDTKRNGGYALSCDHQIEAFDVYEALEFYKYKLQIPSGTSSIEIAQNLIKKLGNLNPTRERLYRSWLNNFETEASFLDNIRFLPIEDLGPGTALPINCSALPVIAQTRVPDAQGKRYFVDLNLWKRLDQFNQAALIVHEIVYREALETSFELENSIGVRAFVALILSDRLPKCSFQNYVEHLLLAKILVTDYRGFEISLKRQDYPGTDQARYLEFVDPETLKVAFLKPESWRPRAGFEKIRLTERSSLGNPGEWLEYDKIQDSLSLNSKAGFEVLLGSTWLWGFSKLTLSKDLQPVVVYATSTLSFVDSNVEIYLMNASYKMFLQEKNPNLWFSRLDEDYADSFLMNGQFVPLQTKTEYRLVKSLKSQRWMLK